MIIEYVYPSSTPYLYTASVTDVTAWAIARSRIEPFGAVAEPEIGKGDVRFFVGHHVSVGSEGQFRTGMA